MNSHCLYLACPCFRRPIQNQYVYQSEPISTTKHNINTCVPSHINIDKQNVPMKNY